MITIWPPAALFHDCFNICFSDISPLVWFYLIYNISRSGCLLKPSDSNEYYKSRYQDKNQVTEQTDLTRQ